MPAEARRVERAETSRSASPAGDRQAVWRCSRFAAATHGSTQAIGSATSESRPETTAESTRFDTYPVAGGVAQAAFQVGGPVFGHAQMQPRAVGIEGFAAFFGGERDQ
jgi:hypothetical protein